jgi:hypothetical protein
MEKYGADYSTIEPSKDQLEKLKDLKEKPKTMKEAQDIIDGMEKTGNENQD